MAEVDPDRPEDMSHLGSEDRRVGINQAVDTILLDQVVPVVGVDGPLGPAWRSREFFKHDNRPPDAR